MGGYAPSGALEMAAIANTAQLFLAVMLFNDVFIHHPKLKGIVVEFAAEPLGWVIAQVGKDMIVFASDFPHPEVTSDPMGKLEKTMSDCDREAMNKFYYQNMEEVLGINLENL